jgi:AcrR family transcriptional regulator
MEEFVNLNSDAVRIKMEPTKSYHHGALHEALLSAAETILCRDGLGALTLRAIAREAGVSHGAPPHHFKDLVELLSELVAAGFERMTVAMQAASQVETGRFAEVAQAYVAFAIGNAALFQLMFRVERLNAGNDRLRTARAGAFTVIAKASAMPAGELSPSQLGAMTAQWCLVQGFASLAANGRLGPLLERGPAGMQEAELLRLALENLVSP